MVDSSVWIDYLNARHTSQTRKLNDLYGVKTLVVGDLVATEVLQGLKDDLRFQRTLQRFRSMTMIDIVGSDVAFAAARNYRHLRALGITVRKTIDTLIATRCILDDLPLLFSDRDFEPFVAHLGLRDAMAELV